MIFTAADSSGVVESIRSVWQEGADTLVVDSYGIDIRHERAFRAAAHAIFVIDDLADRPHDCDMLLDQNFGRDGEDYEALVPAGAEVLAGSSWALLRPEFAASRASALARRDAGHPVRRILISLGLSDVAGASMRAVQAVLAAETGAHLDVVLGRKTEGFSRLEDMAASRLDVTLHVDAADICRLMVEADLAVGAGGTSTWERCCVGLPGIVLVLAENQRDVAARLAALGAVVPIFDPLDAAAMTSAVRRLASDAGARAALSRASAALTDGTGAPKIARKLFALAARQDMVIRRAVIEDCAELWKWRNDETTRRNSKSAAVIPWSDHQRWYADSLQRDDRRIWIAEMWGKKAGMVRFDRNGDERWIVSIAVDPEERGRGIGRSLLAAACARMKSETAGHGFEAEIAVENRASARIFETCGFVLHGPADTPGFNLFRRANGAAN
jgi:UDP-2,4-diacetamido-2,4,6-trideoxy-beta-L-altropyranose hydrolase